jgi:hypothetical protein
MLKCNNKELGNYIHNIKINDLDLWMNLISSWLSHFSVLQKPTPAIPYTSYTITELTVFTADTGMGL